MVLWLQFSYTWALLLWPDSVDKHVPPEVLSYNLRTTIWDCSQSSPRLVVFLSLWFPHLSLNRSGDRHIWSKLAWMLPSLYLLTFIGEDQGEDSEGNWCAVRWSQALRCTGPECRRCWREGNRNYGWACLIRGWYSQKIKGYGLTNWMKTWFIFRS